MHGAWVAFAATGDPGWPKYDPEPAGDDALRHGLADRRRSSLLRAGAVGRAASTGLQPRVPAPEPVRPALPRGRDAGAADPRRDPRRGRRARRCAIPRAAPPRRDPPRDRGPGRRRARATPRRLPPGAAGRPASLDRRSCVPDRRPRRRDRAPATGRRGGDAGARRAAHGPTAGSLPPAVADVVRDRAGRTAGSACWSSSTTRSPTAWPRCAWFARCSRRRCRADGPRAERGARPPPWGALVRDNLRSTIESALRLARPPRGVSRRVVGRAAGRLARPSRPPPSSLNAPVGPRRRLATLRLDLAAARRIARAHGCGVNDVVLGADRGRRAGPARRPRRAGRAAPTARRYRGGAVQRRATTRGRERHRHPPSCRSRWPSPTPAPGCR